MTQHQGHDHLPSPSTLASQTTRALSHYVGVVGRLQQNKQHQDTVPCTADIEQPG